MYEVNDCGDNVKNKNKNTSHGQHVGTRVVTGSTVECIVDNLQSDKKVNENQNSI